jgi:hypothetical protein
MRGTVTDLLLGLDEREEFEVLLEYFGGVEYGVKLSEVVEATETVARGMRPRRDLLGLSLTEKLTLMARPVDKLKMAVFCTRHLIPFLREHENQV